MTHTNNNQTNQTTNDVLWADKGQNAMPQAVMTYLAGNDIRLDRALFIYDIEGTAAHLEGLAAIGLITPDELAQFKTNLAALKNDYQAGDFDLDERYEDGHSAIEMYLTEQLGELGKKAHTGRSRNDQVLTCLRLYMHDQLSNLQSEVVAVIDTLMPLAELHQHTLMPGYTHLQRAMPTTVAVWILGFVESLLDDLQQLQGLQQVLDSSPLGTAAGFGVPLPLERELTAQIMGFGRVQINPVGVQNSRGKFELMVLHGLSYLMSDVRRFAWDLSLFMTSEFDFITLAKTHTTGSSIMPNKNNPDVIELMRAGLSVVEGAIQQVQSLLSLPSGYQRDVQLSKEPLLKGVSMTRQTFALLPGLIHAIEFKTENMRQAITPEMMATDQALQQVKSGESFRDAYLTSKDGQSQITPEQSMADRVSLGGAANLGIDLLKERLTALKKTEGHDEGDTTTTIS